MVGSDRFKRLWMRLSEKRLSENILELIEDRERLGDLDGAKRLSWSLASALRFERNRRPWERWI